MTLSEAQAGSESPDLPLAAEFDTPTRADWQQQVAAALRKSGALPEGFDGDPENLLTTRTYDDIELAPLYTADDETPPTGFPGIAPFVRGRTPEGSVETGWDVRAVQAGTDPAAINEAALGDLEAGASSLWIHTGTGGLGLDGLSTALGDVRIDLAPVTLAPGQDYVAAADALTGLFAERGVPATEAIGTVGADPIGIRARTGTDHDVAPAAELAARLAGSHPGLRTMVVDALPYHEAGSSDAQELGAAAATGVAYLRALTAAGMDVTDAAANLEFRLAATVEQFPTIAKLRAARRIWSRITEQCGVTGDARGMRQHAVSSPTMLTRYDPWVNMLRGTLACFSAGVAGADAVTLLPFDAAIGEPEEFARRIARNTQSILLEESKLAGVIDPAGGSWYVENLTDALAHAAWREFTAIEAAGGIESELSSGALAGRLAQTRQRRGQRIATRKSPVTGVSEFPDLHETAVSRPASPAGDTGGLPRVRYAQDFEKLRDAGEAHRAAHGHHPRVFLATIGTLAAHTARATFASNLFQAGGIEPVNGGATETDEDILAAFADSGAEVACICGTDGAYAERAESLASALKSAGARSVLLAGKPVDYADVDGYAHTGCDALQILTSTLETLGVQA